MRKGTLLHTCMHAHQVTYILDCKREINVLSYIVTVTATEDSHTETR